MKTQKVSALLLFSVEKIGLRWYDMSEKNISNEEGDDSMAALAQYLDTNKEKAYSFATANTRHNQQGRPVISKDDEWLQETEWDDLFNALVREREKGN